MSNETPPSTNSVALSPRAEILPPNEWANPPVAPEPTRPPLERPLAALRRYKWLALGVIGLSIVAAFIAPRFVKPVYSVRATIWVSAETPNADRGGPIRSGGLLASEAWTELLRSYRIADAVVRKLGLYLTVKKSNDAPAFTGFELSNRFIPGEYTLKINGPRRHWELQLANGPRVDSGTVGDSVGRRAGFKWMPPPAALATSNERVINFTVATPRETSVEVMKRLNARLADKSNFLWMTFDDTSATLAASTLNAWLDEYVSVATELKKRNIVEFSNILTGQLDFAENSLKTAEAALENFRVHTITLPSENTAIAPGVEDTRNPTLNSYFIQKIDYDNLRHDREALEKVIANAKTGSVPYESALLIPSVVSTAAGEQLRETFKQLYQKKAELAAARQIYTDQYVGVKEVAKSVATLQDQTIPQILSQMLTQLKVREDELDKRIGGASQDLQQIPTRTIEEMRLRRAVVVAEGLYTTLKNRAAEAKLSEASTTPDVALLDTAVAPFRPTKNTTTRVVLLVLAIGLGAAIGLALLLDMLDGKIRYPEQATHDLGLAIAGTIPRLPKNGVNPQSPEQVSQLLESFRTLRMQVVNATDMPVTLAVSSPSPGDGKSLIAANLAMSFAEAGCRTILVDGDTRRGSLHRTFGLTPNAGLTDYLDGSADLARVVYQTNHEFLSIVPCGPRNRRSPEMLTSPNLVRLVNELRGRYDVVLIDTPPLAAGIDGYAIAAAARHLLLVLRIGKTEKRMAAAKLALADRLPIGMVGAVLNGVELTGEYQYYGYAQGYHVQDAEIAGQIA